MKPKTVTVDDVLSWGPCEEYNRGEIKILFGRRKHLSLRDGLKLKIPPKNILWAALRGPWLDDRQKRLFACDCAERVLPIWERKYPKDKWPRQAIEVARRFADGKATSEELAFAANAAYAAANAAYAAANAAYAAYAASAAVAVVAVVEVDEPSAAGANAAYAAAAAAADAAANARDYFYRWALKRLVKIAEEAKP